MIKKISIILTIVLTAVLAVTLWTVHKEEKETKLKHAQIEAELRPLRVELQDLKDQLDEKEEYYTALINGGAAVTLLFTQTGEVIYEEVMPRMEAYGYHGMFALSEENYPGLEGNMSVKQFRELLDNGWSWCIEWPADQDNSEIACEELAQRAKKDGLSQPGYIWFSEERDQGGHEEWLSQSGYAAIKDTVNWRSDLRRDRFSRALNHGENLVYSITLEQYAGIDISDDLKYIDSMLEWFEAYCQNGSARIVTAEEADAYRDEVEAGSQSVGEEWKPKKESLKQRIEELEETISKIEEKYYRE